MMDTMKKTIIQGEKQGAVLETTRPQPKDDWVVVKIYTAPMCTEYKAWVAGNPSEFLGHEAAGEVVALAQPGKVELGQRVVVMPQYPCGLCDLCLAGEYIHCEQSLNPAEFTGSPEGRATHGSIYAQARLALVAYSR